MKARHFLLMVIFCVFFNTYAQYQEHKWLLPGTTKGIQFDHNTNQPSIVTFNQNSSLSGITGYTIVNHPATGELIFYTDGIKVYDKNHLVMPNGSGLYQDHPIQGGLVCPVPCNPDHYYVFHIKELTEQKLYYSIVDLNLPGNGTDEDPKGDVIPTQKNILLAENASEALAIVKNKFNNYWLLNPQKGSSNIRIYKISANGIQLFATHNLGYVMNYQVSLRGVLYNNFINDTYRFALGSLYGNEKAIAFYFNADNGTIGTSHFIPGTPFHNNTGVFDGITDFEWSYDGNSLYIARYIDLVNNLGGKIYQYQCAYSFPQTNIIEIFSTNGTSSNACLGLKRGPDNRIYFVYKNSVYNDYRLIGTIDKTYFQYPYCEVNPLAIDLINSPTIISKLPEFVSFPKYISAARTSICSGDTAIIQAHGGESYIWNTGDTTAYIYKVPLNTTTYSVTITYSDGCIFSDSVIINVNPLPQPSIYGNLNYCGNSTTLFTDNYPTILWSNGATSNSIQATMADNPISVWVTNEYGCSANSDIVNVTQGGNASIAGNVTYSGGYIGAGDAVATLYKTGPNGHHQVQAATSIGNNGSFQFSGIPAGSYYLYVKLNNNAGYQHVHNSYYDSTFRWQEAYIFNVNCFTDTVVVMHMFETGPQQVGNGEITGNIRYYEASKAIEDYQPVQGANVQLFNNLTQAIQGIELTDTYGNYLLANLPEGNYSMNIDIPGMPVLSTYDSIQINAGNNILNGYNFVVDTTTANFGIYTDPNNTTISFIQKNFSLQVYPNPAKNILNVDYFIKESCPVEIELISLLGKRTILTPYTIQNKGKYTQTILLDGLNLASGQYIVKALISNQLFIKKLIIE